ncbi:hypothetical protein SALBM311S_12762 [Streptomyces alboniger]
MVDPQQVVEDLGVSAVVLLHLPEFVGLLVDDGLDAAGDVDEGALRGVAHDVLGVDDGEQLLEQRQLRFGKFAPRGFVVTEVANHLSGGIPAAQQLERGRQDLLGEAGHLLVVGGDPLFQIRTVTALVRAPGAQGSAAADRFGGRRDHQQRGDGTAPADSRPGRRRHQCDGAPGRRGHRYGGHQQQACVRKFTVSWRSLNTHHVGPLRQVGGGSGELVGGTSWVCRDLRHVWEQAHEYTSTRCAAGELSPTGSSSCHIQ